MGGGPEGLTVKRLLSIVLAVIVVTAAAEADREACRPPRHPRLRRPRRRHPPRLRADSDTSRVSLTGEQIPAPPPCPMAVQINNAPGARPQIGLVDADLVYETPTEAQPMTRCWPTPAPRLASRSDSGPPRSICSSSRERCGGELARLQPIRAPHNLFTSIPGLRSVADQLGWSR
jgi:Protein of unknown function (DUF3048) N-terminal domain